jgi:hypothetical protein
MIKGVVKKMEEEVRMGERLMGDWRARSTSW